MSLYCCTNLAMNQGTVDDKLLGAALTETRDEVEWHAASRLSTDSELR